MPLQVSFNREVKDSIPRVEVASLTELGSVVPDPLLVGTLVLATVAGVSSLYELSVPSFTVGQGRASGDSAYLPDSTYFWRPQVPRCPGPYDNDAAVDGTKEVYSIEFDADSNADTELEIRFRSRFFDYTTFMEVSSDDTGADIANALNDVLSALPYAVDYFDFSILAGVLTVTRTQGDETDPLLLISVADNSAIGPYEGAITTPGVLPIVQLGGFYNTAAGVVMKRLT